LLLGRPKFAHATLLLKCRLSRVQMRLVDLLPHLASQALALSAVRNPTLFAQPTIVPPHRPVTVFDGFGVDRGVAQRGV
jgi:hypothetical protein